MRSLVPVLLVLSCSSLAAGCASFSGYPDGISAKVPPTFSETAYYAESDAAKQALIRNQYIFNRVGAIDEKYNGFARALTTESNSVSLTSDLSLIAVGAAGTLTNSTATKTALAAATTAIVGSAAAINKDLFYQKTVPAVIAQMDADRASVLTTLYTGSKQSTSLYPLQAAMNDLAQYERAGSMPSAITKLTATSQNQATENQAKAAQALVGTYQADDAGDKLATFVNLQGAPNPANVAALKACMAKENPPLTELYPFVVRDAKYAAQRLSLVKCVGL